MYESIVIYRLNSLGYLLLIIYYEQLGVYSLKLGILAENSFLKRQSQFFTILIGNRNTSNKVTNIREHWVTGPLFSTGEVFSLEIQPAKNILVGLLGSPKWGIQFLDAPLNSNCSLLT